MPIRSASDSLESLKDGRDISIEGERVKDVAADPRYAGAARAMSDFGGLRPKLDIVSIKSHGPSEGTFILAQYRRTRHGVSPRRAPRRLSVPPASRREMRLMRASAAPYGLRNPLADAVPAIETAG